MTTIVIIDYGGSNLKSVYKALESVSSKKINVKVSSDVKEIVNSDKIVFPGQGAIGNCMSQLKKTGLSKKIENLCQTKPFLGICLGHQLLATALGGKVEKAKTAEVGIHSISLTDDGRVHGFFKDCPREFACLQWHGA